MLFVIVCCLWVKLILVIYRVIIKVIIVNKIGSRICSWMDKFFSENGMFNFFKCNVCIYVNGSIFSIKNC